ncbi:MAG: PLP-dependent aminotransferase family protein [Bacillota bacterium]
MIYQLDKNKSMYVSLYQQIKNDIKHGKLRAGEKLPSKRGLAEQLKISVITVQNAYEQLISEGYVVSKERSGYFVCDVPKQAARNVQSPRKKSEENPQEKLKSLYHSGGADEIFPFSVWAKNMRQVITDNYEVLLKTIDNKGCEPLRIAISEYLFAARGMEVSKENIIIGAGTEYLYGLIVKLLGRDKTFGVENPCHSKISKSYTMEGAKVVSIPIDNGGVSCEMLEKQQVDIAHTSPNHQFPTGVVMPYQRRVQLMNWAYEGEARFIIEDDYDSEFRFVGKPIPSIFSIDYVGKTIYINTFSKTIAPSLRISYMVLPDTLMEKYNKKLDFISGTVSSFEQYVLAKFIQDGSLERHIKKTKKHYKAVRDEIIDVWKNSKLSNISTIKEEDAGLHFTLWLSTNKSDIEIKSECEKSGIELKFMSDFSSEKMKKDSRTGLLINYAKYNKKDFQYIIDTIYSVISK